MIEACALIYCSQTIDPDPATADGDDQSGHIFFHQLHGRRDADARGGVAPELGPRPVQVFHDVRKRFRRPHLSRRTNHRPRSLQLRSHQR
jgi:hypothetical protein